ncbi:MAG: tRNA (adenosine(37)-N6)-threonylcarbamoyltransferase complex dimerization subunit type 1 TsaB [Proteobacteria bacterium]|nr:tRNA (adenosine(37)-N6)-threonylcarbamoyltransferase complex dimerization subunit type 1 TsaB [Pseudomonadota bacterium]
MPSPHRERQKEMSLVLAFDCAVRGLAVAVVRDGTVLAEAREEGREQAARLLPVIADVLRAAGVERRDLSLIACTTGPGSFTGVRVGLAAARGLALALDIPLAGIATTAALLAEADARDRLAVAAIDSHLGDWFCALGGISAISASALECFVATTAVLSDRLNGKPCLVVGPDASVLAPLLPDALAQVALPDPAVVARLALEQGVETWRVRNRTEGLPRPLYLRGVNITLPDGARRTVDA